jgi:hypothetical protein
VLFRSSRPRKSDLSGVKNSTAVPHRCSSYSHLSQLECHFLRLVKPACAGRRNLSLINWVSPSSEHGIKLDQLVQWIERTCCCPRSKLNLRHGGLSRPNDQPERRGLAGIVGRAPPSTHETCLWSSGQQQVFYFQQDVRKILGQSSLRVFRAMCK